MTRYAREARAARIKCVPCNAPVAVTIDDIYVCVECGEQVLKMAEERDDDKQASVAG